MEIAIISGKGGTGKSSITAAFATMQQDIVLADCDVDAANLYLLFQPTHHEEEVFVSSHKAVIDKDLCSEYGLCVDYCRFDAISVVDGIVKINPTSCDGCYLCSRICPSAAINMIPEDKSRLYSGTFRKGKMVYGRLFPGEENSGRLVDLVRKKARKMADENGLITILLDGPPGIGCPVISTITGVDRVIVVTEPTLSGLHDLKRAIEICSNFHVMTQVIINKYDLNSEMAGKIDDYCRTIDIPVIGMIPFDPLMVEAMLHCRSIWEYAPRSDVSVALKKTFERLIS